MQFKVGKEWGSYVVSCAHEWILLENLGQAAAAATQYFKRICKWDNVEDLRTVQLFGYDLAPIEEEVSQIGMFETQGVEGMSYPCAYFMFFKVYII